MVRLHPRINEVPSRRQTHVPRRRTQNPPPFQVPLLRGNDLPPVHLPHLLAHSWNPTIRLGDFASVRGLRAEMSAGECVVCVEYATRFTACGDLVCCEIGVFGGEFVVGGEYVAGLCGFVAE